MVPSWKYRKAYTPFCKHTTYENEFMTVVILTVNALHKSEMEYHGKVWHTLGYIKHISIMIKIYICSKSCQIGNQTVSPTIPVF